MYGFVPEWGELTSAEKENDEAALSPFPVSERELLRRTLTVPERRHRYLAQLRDQGMKWEEVTRRFNEDWNEWASDCTYPFKDPDDHENVARTHNKYKKDHSW